jgi:site-specific recombinase XerD
MLRHFLATRVLEAGTDIRCIQNLPGHLRVSTKVISIHVARRNTVATPSPIDGVLLEGSGGNEGEV